MVQVNFRQITENFWKLHPDLKIVNPFKTQYELDTSKDKLTTSQMMWFIALCYDKESKFSKMPIEGEDGKHLLIGEDFMNEKWYYEENKDQLDKLIESYINIQYTALERQLFDLEETLDVRRGVIKELRQSKNPKDWKDIDVMVRGTKQLVDEVASIKAKIAEENMNGLTKGGASKSIND